MSFFPKILIHIFLLVSLVSCSGISMLSGSKRSDLYSDVFMKKINLIKSEYKQGRILEALVKLKTIDEQKLLPTEKAMRRNLIGVIQFSNGNLEQAIYNFNLALSTSRLDEALTAQIYLNEASSYYKLGHMEKSFSLLTFCEFRNLNKDENKKFHQLNYRLAKELDRGRVLIKSLVWFLADKKEISQITSEPMYQELLNEFFGRTKSEKLRILEEFEDSEILIISYIGYLEAEKEYYKGNKEGAKDILEWILDRPGLSDEMKRLVDNFSGRMQKFTKMNPYSIGIVLPMTGDKKKFGERALMGIDDSFRELIKRDRNIPYELHLKDSNGSGAAGSFRVRELIEKNSVSVIIGGLFSSEAEKEYLEAKKYGVFFISLSQIFLPKEEKDFLLLEIPGSIESQISKLFDSKMLENFGKRAAVIYPKSDRGEAIINEFWRKAKINNVKVSGVFSYLKKTTDHRETVKKLLGLKFTRERQEELDMLKEIHSLEKNRSTRRIQTLKPIIDFDWVFLPAYPREALQIIPSFTYYDAFNLNIIGGPSWRSKALSRESYKIPNLYFIGDDVNKKSKIFSNDFYARYGKYPRLVEMRAYDALTAVHKIIGGETVGTRDELAARIKGIKSIEGITGNWLMQDGVWLKNMTSLKLRRGKISKVLK